MKVITDKALAAIQAEIEEALARAGSVLGVKIRVTNLVKDENSGRARATIDVSVIDSPSRPLYKEEEDFIHYAPLIGMTEEDLHRPIRIAGKSFVISGYYPGQRLAPVLLLDEEGIRFKASADSVRQALKL